MRIAILFLISFSLASCSDDFEDCILNSISEGRAESEEMFKECEKEHQIKLTINQTEKVKIKGQHLRSNNTGDGIVVDLTNYNSHLIITSLFIIIENPSDNDMMWVDVLIKPFENYSKFILPKEITVSPESIVRVHSGFAVQEKE